MRGKEYWKQWWKAAAVRALRTFSQSALAAIPVAISIEEVLWGHVLGVAALAAVMSMLTSLAGLPELEEGFKED